MTLRIGKTNETINGPDFRNDVSLSTDVRDKLLANYLYSPSGTDIAVVQTQKVNSSVFNKDILLNPSGHLEVTKRVESNQYSFYNRFLGVYNRRVLGTVFNFGATTINSILHLNIWNGSRVKATVSAIDVDIAGVFTLEGIEVGTVFNPYEEKELLLTVLPTAPSAIDLVLTMVTDIGSFYINVAGPTSVIIPMRAQLGEIREFIKYKTQIIESKNGKEQRLLLRSIPRHDYALDFITTQEDQESRKLINKIYNQYPRSFTFGLMWSEMTLASNITSFSFEADTSYGRFEVDKNVMLWQDSQTYTLAIISEIAGSVVTVLTEIPSIFTNTVYCSPIDLAFLGTRPTFKTDANGNFFGSLDFRGTEIFANLPEMTFEYTYGGIPVLLWNKLFNSKTESHSINAGTELIDMDIGPFSYTTPWPGNKQTYQLGRHGASVQDGYELRQFAQYMKGRQKSVWVPTLDNDFVMAEEISIGGTTIVVLDNEFTTYYNLSNNDMFLNLAITDGTVWYFREIIGLTLDESGNQVILLDSPLDVSKGFALGSLKISFMPLCRQESDTIEIEWITPDEFYSIISLVGVMQ